jgi:two-component system cell cycle sensor histidine kinase/response regulator CckA
MDAIDGAVRMKLIVADLYQFTRPAKPTGDHGNVADAIGAALKMAASHLRSKASVHTDIGPVPPVRGDTMRLTQVFLNLVVNAAQAMPEGHAADNRVDIRAWVENEQVLVEIEDTGEGMPPDVIERASDAFFSTKPTGQGLGLGLALTHTILESAGGKLKFESRPGRTVARVWLALAPKIEEAVLQNPPAPSHTSTKREKLAVLIVDDEASLARALSRVLRDHEVSIAASGREALQLIQEGREFDLVLCDVMMPELSGMDVYEAIERDHPEWLDRVVFMTGGTFTERARAFQERIPNTFLSKPIEAATLLGVIQERRDAAIAKKKDGVG